MKIYRREIATFIYPITLYMKAKEILDQLYADGWLEKEQRGSHLQLIHPLKSGKVTVPMHKGDLPKGTVHSILKQAGLK